MDSDDKGANSVNQAPINPAAVEHSIVGSRYEENSQPSSTINQNIDLQTEAEKEADLIEATLNDSRASDLDYHRKDASGGVSITWSAPEFKRSARSTAWYSLLAVMGVALALVVYIFTKDLISVVAIVTAVVMVALYSGNKPHIAKYEISNAGIKISDKIFGYSLFKTFSIVHDENILYSLRLTPLKRFGPPLIIPLPPEEEQSIKEIISNHLTYKEEKIELTEKIFKFFHI